MEQRRVTNGQWICNRCKGELSMVSDCTGTKIWVSDTCERRELCARDSIRLITETEGEC